MRVAVIPGDGTGPEVVAEATKVLDAVAARFGIDIDYEYHELGGDRYIRTGEVLPDAELKSLSEVDAILFGAVGHPDVAPGILERGIIVRLRRDLGQYINLRPIKLYPGVRGPLRDKNHEDIDFVVVRENSEGLYSGRGSFAHHGTADEVAIEESVNTRHGVERCIRFAFELALTRPRRHLTMCGKTNILMYAQDLWQRVFDEVAAEYPDVTTAYAHVDAVCLWMVLAPERFDVIVADNLFGDIITDLGAAIQGGLGVAVGANLNPEGVSMFEPIGGTAPDVAGKGKINPLASIGAAGMLLTHNGQPQAGAVIDAAVARVAGELSSLDAGAMGMTTSEVGDRVVELVAR
ncbi:MAG: 3-isopropylmalate dehydrogenase [Acidimicrobiia bacterium]|nr:3-isopropylmalate dehydrogenase [Acidimicrobiia bacterium]